MSIAIVNAAFRQEARALLFGPKRALLFPLVTIDLVIIWGHLGNALQQLKSPFPVMHYFLFEMRGKEWRKWGGLESISRGEMRVVKSLNWRFS